MRDEVDKVPLHEFLRRVLICSAKSRDQRMVRMAFANHLTLPPVERNLK